MPAIDPRVTGDADCHGAVFVYKSDNTADNAWKHVQGLATKHRIRGEAHRSKSTFLRALTAWSSRVDSRGAMLMIYAHMGSRGMVPESGAAPERVTWAELAEALGNGVHTLWLIGCTSVLATKTWSPLRSPVRGYLLATHEKAPFRPFLPVFGNEVSMDVITPFDKMLERIVSHNPELGSKVAYYYSNGKTWNKGIRPSDRAGRRRHSGGVAACRKRSEAAAARLRNAKTRKQIASAITSFTDAIAREREAEFLDDFYRELEQRLGDV